MDKKRKAVIAGFFIFLVAMGICSLVTKGIYTAGLPRVTATTPREMSLYHPVSVLGAVETGQEYGIYVPSGLRVASIAVQKGDSFLEGEALLQLDVEDMEHILAGKELERQRLACQQREAESQSAQGRQQGTRTLTRAQEDYEAVQKNGELQVGRARENYLRAQAVLDDLRKQLDQARKDLEQYRKQLEQMGLQGNQGTNQENHGGSTVSGSDNAQIHPPAGSESDAQPAMPAEGESDVQPAMLAGSESDVQPAMPAGSESDVQPAMPAEGESDVQPAMPAGSKSDVQPAMPAESGNNAQSATQTGNGDSASQDASAISMQITELEALIRQLQAQAGQQEEAVIAAAQAAEDARLSQESELLAAQRSVQDAREAANGSYQAAADLARLEQAYLEEEIQELRELIDAGGWIYAREAGRITRLCVGIGQRTPDTAQLLYTPDDGLRLLQARLDKEQARYVSEGTRMQMSFETVGGGKQSKEGIISYMENREDGSILIQLDVTDQGMELGQQVTLKSTWQSENYSLVVPMAVLHQDGNGSNFVYILRQQNGILGVEWHASVLYVDVLDQNSHYAAIESGSLSEETQIIQTTSAELKDNAVVRIVE